MALLHQNLNLNQHDQYQQDFLHDLCCLLRFLQYTVKNVVDNIDHVKNLVGIDHVGLGSDFDGEVPLPEDINDVSKFPNLIEELLIRGYTEDEIDKILNGNILRVWKAVREFAKN